MPGFTCERKGRAKARAESRSATRKRPNAEDDVLWDRWVNGASYCNEAFDEAPQEREKTPLSTSNVVKPGERAIGWVKLP